MPCFTCATCLAIQMQTVIQKMQHSECGVAVRPFTRRFMTVVPCAFTGVPEGMRGRRWGAGLLCVCVCVCVRERERERVGASAVSVRV